MTLRGASLCTGIGGLDLGVASVLDINWVWHAEIEARLDPIAHQAIGIVPNIGDFTTVDWSGLAPIDVLTAGYPCQPFSHAGQRKGTSDVRHLWPHIAEAVRVLRPRLVVLENVAGHLSLGFGEVLGDLAATGFDAEWCVLRASDVGACHQRARLFIIATDTSRPGVDDMEVRSGEPRWSLFGGDNRPVDPDPDCFRCEGSITGSRRNHRRDDRPSTADADAGTARRKPGTVLGTEDRRRDHPERDGLGDGRWSAERWGPFWPAVDRWERVLGRRSPAPVDDRGRLDPPFVEWMMGYPEGWVNGLARTSALRALGNAVCPQQAKAAIRLLIEALP